MSMITLMTIVIVLAMIAGFCIAFEFLCNRLDRTELADIIGYEARHDHTRPRLPPVLDPFSWAATEALIDRERERLASTGELRALYEHPYPYPYPGAVSETGELRALAEAGDADTIRTIVDAWKSDHLEDGA